MKNHLTEIHKFLLDNKKTINEVSINRKVDWRFVPPNAPHFAGLSKAGIKSAKYHLKRVIGDQTLTFEEMGSYICEKKAKMQMFLTRSK